MIDLEDLKARLLKRPKNFLYAGNLDLSYWGFTPLGKHRDSDLLDQSNYDYALEALKDADPDAVDEIHSSHFAVGWYDNLMVDTRNEKVLQCLAELLERLENYPILDESDLSQREWNQAQVAYDDWAAWDVRKMIEEAGIQALLDEDGDYSPSPENEDKVRGIVADAIMAYNASSGVYEDSDLLERLHQEFDPEEEVACL